MDKINDYGKIFANIRQRNETHSLRNGKSNQLALDFKRFVEQQENTLKKAEQSGYDSKLTIPSSKISNKYYQGDDYTVIFDGFNVTLKNKTKNYTKTFNIYNFVSGMDEKDKVEFLKKIQTLPGEVLEDLATEMDRLKSASGQNMHIVSSNPNFTAGGFYSSESDSITTKPKHLVHELGHAVDYNSNGISSAANDSAFKALFAEELSNYIKAGNKRYNYNDNSSWASPLDKFAKKSNYCTANEKEMFAEIYDMCMTGDCRSINTITKFFPKTLARGRELLAKIRLNNDEARHNSEIRRIMNSLS